MTDGKVRDALIIGAGVTGIYMLHRLLEQGLDVIALEKGAEPGGTWFWNRYPGARFDSESYTYGYSFSREIFEEWNWSEHFAGQPETRRYLNFVIDKLSIRDHIQCDSTVKSATFDDGGSFWRIELTDGRIENARYLCTAIGVLSAPTPPRIKGVDSFEGEAFHTFDWPHDHEVELAGKRVAVIGTGATGIQLIAEIADKVGELTVFQRRPNWSAPLNNAAIDEATQADLNARYEEIFAGVKANRNGFLHVPEPRSYNDVSKQERIALWEELYASKGFGVWLSNFVEAMIIPEVNAEYSEFIADKIRARVNDPITAEKLIPKDHGFGARRLPLETRYFEAYNRDNVHLIDLLETPIDCITPTGIKTTQAEYEFDLIIYATGFDAVTGAFDRMEITGLGGQKLADKWKDGPSTAYGMQTAGFPNLITVAGPQSASASSNFPPAIEACVDWSSDLIAYMNKEGHTRIEPLQDTEDKWCQEIKQGLERTMLATTKSWFTGYNSNVEGHDKVRYLLYLGGAPAYRKQLGDEAEKDYPGFKIS